MDENNQEVQCWEAWQWAREVTADMRAQLADDLDPLEAEAWLAYLADEEIGFGEEDRAYSVAEIAQLCRDQRGLIGQVHPWAYLDWAEVGEQSYTDRYGDAALDELRAAASETGKRAIRDILSTLGKEEREIDQDRYWWHQDSMGYIYLFERSGQQEAG